LRIAGLGLTLLLVPAAISSWPARSQGVQLIQVDVSVVDKGLRASKLIGQGVVSDNNERIGSIDDIIIGQGQAPATVGAGQAVGQEHKLYAVLQVGGFLGIGSRLVAVPYDSLHIDEQNGRVQKVELPGATKDQLQRLAEFRYRS
jgi:hypothetical protein